MTLAPATTAAPTHAPPSWLLKLTLLLTASLTILAGATISPSLPGITAAYAGTAHIELLSRLVLTLPALFVVVASPIIGRVADRVGRSSLLIGTIVLYAIAGSSGLWLESLHGLLVGRALLGVAVAGIMTLGMALAGDYFDGAELDRYMGLQQAFTGFGGLVFLTAGGFLADINWRYPFVIYAFALPLAFLAWRVLTEPMPDRLKGNDPSGVTLANPAGVLALCVVALFVSGAFYIIPSQLPYRLKELGFMSPSLAGLSMGLMTFVSAMASLTFGRLRGRMGAKVIFVVGLAAMALGITVTGAGTTLLTVMCGTGLTGLGMGIAIPNIFASAMALASPQTRGRTAGVITASLFLGQFVSPLLSQPIIAAFHYPAAFYAAAVLTIAALLPALRSGSDD